MRPELAALSPFAVTGEVEAAAEGGAPSTRWSPKGPGHQRLTASFQTEVPIKGNGGDTTMEAQTVNLGSNSWSSLRTTGEAVAGTAGPSPHKCSLLWREGTWRPHDPFQLHNQTRCAFRTEHRPEPQPRHTLLSPYKHPEPNLSTAKCAFTFTKEAHPRGRWPRKQVSTWVGGPHIDGQGPPLGPSGICKTSLFPNLFLRHGSAQTHRVRLGAGPGAFQGTLTLTEVSESLTWMTR